MARGRGAYYRARYGGRGNASSSHRNIPPEEPANTAAASNEAIVAGGAGWQQLAQHIRSIDGQQYGAYKRLAGKYQHQDPIFSLAIDHVQSDAFAPPSRVRAIVPLVETGLPREYLHSDIHRVALCDYVTRVCASIIRSRGLDQNATSGGNWSGPKGGAFNICAPGQEILPRTSVVIDGDSTIELHFTVVLPAAGRTILGQTAQQILAVSLPELVKHSLFYSNLDQDALRRHVACAEVQHVLRKQLSNHKLTAFIANGSILPRVSGASALPKRADDAVAFQSPKELEVTLDLPDGASVSGMGLPRGISLLTGGGFHGKSTVLEAIQTGIYNHIPGDGRELVLSDSTAVKIRAEDGRSVTGVDISPYISCLPGGKQTTQFSTDDASGSTSMAANIQEALETGCKTLLIDEDSSATNLLVRDQRMQKLIQNEPITPLVAKARSLYEQYGVSTVIVIGGLGDWLSIADTVIAMEDFAPRLVTAQAQEIVRQYPTEVLQSAEYGTIPTRSFRVALDGMRSPYAARKDFIALKSHKPDPVHDPSAGESGIDISSIDQLVETGQSRSLAHFVQQVAGWTSRGALPLASIFDEVGDVCLPTSPDGDLVAVRKYDVAAVLSRLRGVQVL